MSATDSPSLVDVIAETLTGEVWISFWDGADEEGAACGVIDASDRQLLAAAVVARCQGLTVEQQAELLPDLVVESSDDQPDSLVPGFVRVVGPWRRP